MMARYSELQSFPRSGAPARESAVPPRADRPRGRCPRTSEPAVEMFGVDRQRQMLGHRRAMIAPGSSVRRDDQNAHIRCRCGSQSRIRASKTGPSKFVGADLCVEGAHETFDHRLINSGPRLDLGVIFRAARLLPIVLRSNMHP